jgi:hypothetical protein
MRGNALDADSSKTDVQPLFAPPPKPSPLIGRIPNWLRWPLSPIASIASFFIVGVVANIVAKIFVFFTGDRGGGFNENFFTFLVVPGLASYAAVHIGALVAPSAQKITAVVYASICAALCGAFSVWIFVGGDYKFLIVIASITVGSAIAALQEEHEFGG